MFVPAIESIPDAQERAATLRAFDDLVADHKELHGSSELETAVEQFDMANEHLSDALREIAAAKEPVAASTHEALGAASRSMRQLVRAIQYDASMGDDAAMEILASIYCQSSGAQYAFVRSHCGNTLNYDAPELSETFDIVQEFCRDSSLRSPEFTDVFVGVYEGALAIYTSDLINYIRNQNAPDGTNP